MNKYFRKLYHTTSIVCERPIKYKNVAVNSYVKTKYSTRNSKERLYGWGYAGTGALGEGEFVDPKKDMFPVYRQKKPWRIKWSDKEGCDLTHIACGNGFSLISISGSKIHKGHQLFGTGINTDAQIGVHEGPNKDSYKYIIRPALINLPYQSDSKIRILGMACGRAHSAVLTNLGVVTFGNNSYGQCGRPIVENEQYFSNRSIIQDIKKFMELDKDDSVISIKAGQDHTCFLTKTGKVLTCGWSADGQLGRDTYTLDPIPRPVRGDLDGNKIIQLATRGDFVLALNDKGEIFGWGNNEYKQLAMTGTKEPQIKIPLHLKLPSYIKTPIISISASGTNCTIIDSDHNVWTWGYGLLGRGPKCEESAMPAQIPNTLFGIYPQIEHLSDRKPISTHSGLYCSSVLLDDGSLYMWGRNYYGNLGTGEAKDSYMPFRVNVPARVRTIDCGPDHTLAICKTNL